MSSAFVARLVNGPFGDPGLYIHLRWEGRALLFDLGHNDTLPAADTLSISWESTQVLEGPVTLHLKATDSFGGVSDLFVPVTVDNVPFGIVTAHVSAGAPIAGARPGSHPGTG